MENELSTELLSAIEALGPLAGFAPTEDGPIDVNDIMNYTVGEYLDLLDYIEQQLESLRPTLQALLQDPGFRAELDPDELTFLQDFAAGNNTEVTQGFAEARAALSQYPRDTLISSISGIDTGSEVQAAFDEAEARLAELLWTDANGIFTSPTFTVDPDTGAWSVDGAAFSGSSLNELWALMAEAVSNSLYTYLGSQTALIAQLASEGIDDVDLAFAASVAQAASAQALAALQTFGAAAQGSAALDLTVVEQQALDYYEAILQAMAEVIPELEAPLNDLILGLQGANPNALVALESAASGTNQSDLFYFNDLANIFNAGAGADLLFGFGGNDRFTGGADDDTILGGEGDVDTAVYSGSASRYILQIDGEGTVQVIDRSGADGTDTLTGVELLDFSGREGFRLVDQLGVASLSAEEIATIVELYIAYFNRAPDAEGLNFWGSAYANGVSLEDIATLILGDTETQQTYPASLSNLEFATQVYNNVLGRDPDQGGLEFWVNALDIGGVTRDQFILEALRGAKVAAPEGSSAEEIALRQGDVAYLAEKTDIGTYFSVIRGLSDVTDANIVMDLFLRGEQTTINDAFEAINTLYTEALGTENGDFLIQLVGVVDDPFAI